MSGYVIQVGSKPPQEVIIAYPDRVTGQPTGTQFKTQRGVGSHLIINRARVWARRVLPNGKLPELSGAEATLQAIDPAYKGDLEFLPWGTNKTGAQAIEIRYLAISSSLDYDYQKNVQKIETKPEDGTDYIILSPGENKFDPNKEALKIQFLQVHPQNDNSVSKNPDPMIKGSTYREVTARDEDRVFVAKKESSLDAGLYIRNLSSKPEQLMNLLEIFSSAGVDFGQVNHLSGTTDVYKALLIYSDLQPDEMMKRIQYFKDQVMDRFKYAESFNALDTSKDGFVAMRIGDKTELLMKEVPAKGKKMLDWMIENFADPTVYSAIKHLKALCEKLK